MFTLKLSQKEETSRVVPSSLLPRAQAVSGWGGWLGEPGSVEEMGGNPARGWGQESIRSTA